MPLSLVLLQMLFHGDLLSRWHAVRVPGGRLFAGLSDTTLAVFCVGSALQTGAQSLTELTVGRGIGGIGIGALRYAFYGSVSNF